MNTPLRFLFAAGGTGGHVYPALAIADAVRRLRPDAEIAFAGTRDRMEWAAVPKAGYAIHPITAAGLPRRLSAALLRWPRTLVRGLAESRALVRSFAPDVAVGTGGFVSGPVLWAAQRAGVPTVIQEQNAAAGLTNRLLGRRAAAAFVAFDAAAAAFPAGRATVLDNPVRAGVGHADRGEGRAFFGLPAGADVLLVFGGSLGAQALNEAVLAALPALLARPNTAILWATGPRYFDRTEAALREAALPADAAGRVHLVPYLDRMDLAYAAADLALCRAGGSITELKVTGTPSVLVPSPNVAGDHQTPNARAMEAAGAAVHLPETALATRLVPTLDALLDDPERRATMSAAARRPARPDAADVIARRVVELAEAHRAARVA